MIEIHRVTGSTEKIKGVRSNSFFLGQNRQRTSDEAISRTGKWSFFESLEL